MSKQFVSLAEEMIKDNNRESIRIDTHMDNKVMQSLLHDLNYEYCGKVMLEVGGERIAYEKSIR